MDRHERQLRQDRLLRDAAQALINADIERVRGDLEHKTIGRRALERVRDGAAELADNAKAGVGGNIGVIALGTAALALFLARNPVMALFRGAQADSEDNPQPPTGDNP